MKFGVGLLVFLMVVMPSYQDMIMLNSEGNYPVVNKEACIRHCSGTTIRGKTPWKPYSTTGMYVDVYIAGCGFKTIPTVVTSLEGRTSHWILKGTSSVYSVTTTTFRVYIYLKDVGVSYTYANKYWWNIDWHAVGYTC